MILEAKISQLIVSAKIDEEESRKILDPVVRVTEK